MLKSWLYIIPFLLFLAIMALLWKGLQRDPHQLPSALIGKAIPTFRYPSLLHPDQKISDRRFLGHVSLLNVWATWCITCHAEHPVLMDIAATRQVTIFGLNYKDDFQKAAHWLQSYGNPYQDVIFDNQGTLAIDFGVYGTPETFLIDSHGIIRYKHIGAISPQVWQDELAPLVKKWSKNE